MGGRGSSSRGNQQDRAVRPSAADSELAPYGRFEVAMPSIRRSIRLAMYGGPDERYAERDRERGADEVRYYLAGEPVGTRISYRMGSTSTAWTKEAEGRWSMGGSNTFGDRDVARDLTSGIDVSSVKVEEPRRGQGGRQPSPQERTRARVYATGNRWAIENYNATH